MSNPPSRTLMMRTGAFFVVAALFSSMATAGVGVWTTNGPPGALESPIIADPQRPGTLYAGQSYLISAGPYKSTDDGVTWALAGYLRNPKPLATAPPSTVYVSDYACGEAVCSGDVWVSPDGGATWTVLYQPTGFFPSFQMVVDPATTTTLYLGQNTTASNSLSKSTDAGATWTRVDSGLGLDSAVISTMIGTKMSGTLYVATHGLFKTVDAGATWVQLNNAPSGIAALAVDPTNPSIIYAGTANGVFKSVDGGATFALTSAGLTSTSASSFAINPLQPTNVFVGTGGGVFQSADGGATWRSLNNGLTDLNVNTLAIDSTGGFLHAGTSTGVFDYQIALSTCTADSHTLCLNRGRFSVTATFQQTPEGPSSPATAVPLTADTGYFWFFDSTNVEMVVKVLTGCSVNNEYWVFAGGLTDVGVQMTVTDTVTGASKMYSNTFGTPFQPVQDSSAFPCP
jgi:photosystem II stability/assembly factor-like uncharacterized protein